MAVIRLMWPLVVWPLVAFLVAFSALAVRAAGGPIDESAGPASEVKRGSALGTTETGVLDPVARTGTPGAPDPGAKPRAGNPLWTLPLSDLSATRDRPLFSPSRRPPIVAVPIVAPPPKQEALAPPPPERPSLTLVGTIVGRKATIAMLQSPNTDTVLRLRVGQENDGWQVRGISLRSIVVEKGPQSVELGLPKANGAPAE
jgi:general secretion pathway protein N